MCLGIFFALLCVSYRVNGVLVYGIVFVSVCLCSLGLKVPSIVEEVKTSLAAGLCVVIGLQTTGEVFEIYYSFTCT